MNLAVYSDAESTGLKHLPVDNTKGAFHGRWDPTTDCNKSSEHQRQQTARIARR
jgi:hypothetical protein